MNTMNPLVIGVGKVKLASDFNENLMKNYKIE